MRFIGFYAASCNEIYQMNPDEMERLLKWQWEQKTTGKSKINLKNQWWNESITVKEKKGLIHFHFATKQCLRKQLCHVIHQMCGNCVQTKNDEYHIKQNKKRNSFCC